MIKSFRHKGLRDFFETGRGAEIQASLRRRCRICLDVLEEAHHLSELRQVRALKFHRLHGKPTRYTVHVNGPWRKTFEWRDGDAYRVDLEQYH